jgi:phosphate transport system permease protein
MKSTTTDKIATVVLYVLSFSFVILLALFVGYFIVKGWSELNLHFLVSPPKFAEAGGGIGPQLFNSIYLVFLANSRFLSVFLPESIWLNMPSQAS